jgi:hypothetical protein
MIDITTDTITFAACGGSDTKELSRSRAENQLDDVVFHRVTAGDTIEVGQDALFMDFLVQASQE